MVDAGPLEEFVDEHGTLASRAFLQPGESRITRWFRYDGDRERVAGALLLGVLLILLFLGVVWPVQYQDLLTETTMVQNVFTTLLSGVILLVSIVVSVAGVGITQELTTVGEQSERVDTTIEYRERVKRQEDMEITPARTDRFLVTILESIRTRAIELEEIADRYEETEFRRLVALLIDDIDTNTEELIETLNQVESGRADELLVGLDYDCSWQLHLTNRLLAEYGDQLTEDDRDAIEQLSETLRQFMIGREYFKSLYYKREFSALSTTLLTVSLPVIIFISYVLLALDAGRFPEIEIVGLSPLAIFISMAFTIALAPYVLLTSYIFRAASVTMRTLATGTFVHGGDDPYKTE